MAHTDKDRGWRVKNRNAMLANRALKREGNKRARKSWKFPRYSKRPFYDFNTKRTFYFYY